MAAGISALMNGLWQRRLVRRLANIAAAAEEADLVALSDIRPKLREIDRRVAKAIQITESKLAMPMVGSEAMERPLHSDWVYRPEFWRLPVSPPGRAGVKNGAAFGSEVKLFHNCELGEITLRQTRNLREEDLAPFSLQLDVFNFEGSFLSLALQLPGAALAGLSRKHLIGLAATIDCEQPLEVFARLNIRHGPNTAQLVRELPQSDREHSIDFDLAYANFNEKRVDSAWIDLIFEAPGLNRILLRDVTLSRRPRSEV